MRVILFYPKSGSLGLKPDHAERKREGKTDNSGRNVGWSAAEERPCNPNFAVSTFIKWSPNVPKGTNYVNFPYYLLIVFWDISIWPNPLMTVLVWEWSKTLPRPYSYTHHPPEWMWFQVPFFHRRKCPMEATNPDLVTHTSASTQKVLKSVTADLTDFKLHWKSPIDNRARVKRWKEK